MTGLVLRGGLVCDPEAGTLAAGDVVVRDGRIGGTAEATDEIVDVSGLVVTPGLVDLHTHVFVGQDLGVDPDEAGPPSGVTTMVDTGSAGAHLFGAFVRGTVERVRTRIGAFINISTVGTTSILLSGELKTLPYVDVAACRAAIAEHRDRIIGVKVRASADVAGDNGVVALDRAREVADAEGLPLMVHLGPPPASLADILARLGPGDVLTHCFTGLSGTPYTEHGRVIDLVAEARQRGVLFDIGHGMCGFDLEQARAAVAAGFLPDTISSDLHTYSRPIVGDLPAVMAKFLGLGVALPEVVRRTTLNPARIAGFDGVGTLRPGAPADIAVLRVTETVEAVLTVRAGEIVYRAPN
ncbi:amidohydrolase family protein [Dactylosporangium sucinum]|uniref:Amidohydrolase n=1 Tax=Dactylosporangium sucinum TaxID=1424081 RepID=A0A917WT35_9ACTN|nr:amidohydrolase/deacetylase family metallohydrolase [Dactylosporangium sucinum]GGM25910.1 amidohydrolase [Dactylosporangium sucinum]